MNLDDLKSNWQNQKAPQSGNLDQQNHLLGQIRKFDQRVFRQNRLVTLLFVLTSLALLVIMLSFNSFDWRFYGSIGGILLLMTLMLWLFWQRKILPARQDFTQNNAAYLKGRIRLLAYNKRISRIFIPLYGLILCLLVIIYISAVIPAENLQLQFWVYGLSIAWITGALFFGVRRQLKKDKKTIDPILEELKTMLNDLKED